MDNRNRNQKQRQYNQTPSEFDEQVVQINRVSKENQRRQ